MAERHGADRVREAFDALLDYAERRTRAAIADMPDGRYEAAEALEGDGVTDGGPLDPGRGDDRRRRR